MTSGTRSSGWYDDPSGKPNTLRWWDGSAWTNETSSTKSTGPRDAQPDPRTISISAVGASHSAPSAEAPTFTAPPPVAVPPQAAAQAPFVPLTPAHPMPTPVVFETVEPNRGRTRALLAVGAVVLALVAGGVGYVIGASGKSKSPTTTTTAGGSSAPSANPSSADGFFGTKLTGGVTLPNGQSITGPKGKMTFSLPSDWQPQVDPKAPTDARYAISAYACPGHGNGACQRGLAIQNLRVLNGGWSDPKSLVLGMGQLLYQSRVGSATPTNVPPLKQSQTSIGSHDAYLALWHVPMVANQGGVPDAYCGVIAVNPTQGGTVMAVLQICLDNTSQAPALSQMDSIANSIKITP